MTGAGKSWTARRIIEELARKNYPIVIFDPHGDYTGLADVPEIGKRVKRFYAYFPVFEEDAETVASIVDTLGYPLTPTMRGVFDQVFTFASRFIIDDKQEMAQRVQWLSTRLANRSILEYGLKPDMWLVGNLAEAAELVIRQNDQQALAQLAGMGMGRNCQLFWHGWANFRGY